MFNTRANAMTVHLGASFNNCGTSKTSKMGLPTFSAAHCPQGFVELGLGPAPLVGQDKSFRNHMNCIELLVFVTSVEQLVLS